MSGTGCTFYTEDEKSLGTGSPILKGYGADCVNKNMPVLTDFKQYQREYQANLRKKKRLLSEQESSEQN